MAAHATILNEYGWLWLRRDGEPTLLTDKLYPKLLGPASTKDERLELNAYLLAGKTEYWRSQRNYAGILHFVYLTCSYPGVFTADHFEDVKALKLNPWFADYMSEAMKPLGVYLSFFQPTLGAGEEPLLPRDDGQRPLRRSRRASCGSRSRPRTGARSRARRRRSRSRRSAP